MDILKNSKLRLFVALAFILLTTTAVQGGWKSPTESPTDGNKPPPINVGATSQTKEGSIWTKGGLRADAYLLSVGNIIARKRVIIGDQVYYARVMPGSVLDPDDSPEASKLTVAVNGKIGATEYCNEEGLNCFKPSSVGAGGGGGGGGGGGAPDPAVWQKRIYNDCVGRGAISLVGVDGNVACQAVGGGGGPATGDNLGDHTTTKSLKISYGDDVNFLGWEGFIRSKIRLTFQDQLDLTGDVRIYDAVTNRPGSTGQLLAADGTGAGVWKNPSDIVESVVKDTLEFSGLCKAGGGLGNNDTCDLGTKTFCALAQETHTSGTGGATGTCRVYKSGSNWKLYVQTGVGIRSCRAVCF